MKSVPATILLAVIMIALAGLAAKLGLWNQPIYLTVILLVVLLWLSWFDLTEMRLPDFLTLPLIAAGLTWAVFVTHQPVPAAIGAVAGYIMIWGLGVFWQKVRGQQGIGLGDAKLLAASGAWLGWVGLPFALMIASATGLLVAGLMSLGMRRQIEFSSAIPFGPFLALGFWVTWSFGNDPQVWLR